MDEQWQPTATDPATAPAGEDRRRAVVRGAGIVLVVTAVTLALAAVAGAITARTMLSTDGTRPVECGERYCIPTLSPEALRASLQKQGFDCHDGASSITSDGFRCELQVGDTWYEATVRTEGGLVESVSARVSGHRELPLPPRTEPFLEWFAGAPFGLDPEADAATYEWLAGHLGEPGMHNATIRGFRYQLSQDDPRRVGLTISGGRG